MSDDNPFEDDEHKSRVGLILGGIAGAALLLFVFQNTHDVEINFLWFGGSMPAFLLILITMVLTVIVTVMGMWLLGRRKK